MNQPELHPQLAADCHILGKTGCGRILLHHNAAIPWFILVPDTQLTELHELDTTTYQEVMSTVQQLGAFVKRSFDADKINIAAIGNQVPQLHIHVIGRRQDDPWWPHVIWGQAESSDEYYSDDRLAAIRAALVNVLPLTP